MIYWYILLHFNYFSTPYEAKYIFFHIFTEKEWSAAKAANFCCAARQCESGAANSGVFLFDRFYGQYIVSKIAFCYIWFSITKILF